MKYLFSLVFSILAMGAVAQQPLQPKKANLLILNKPYQIVYKDTLYKGAREMQSLFYKTHDADIINLFHKHQSNKIAGNILNTAGGLMLTFGIIYATGTGNSNQKTTGWIVAGSGFVGSIVGTLLISKANQHIMNATSIFNNKYATAGLGFTNNGVGLRIQVK
jgi:hypothetical protein